LATTTSLHEFAHDLAPLIAARIERDATLVPVHLHEEAALASFSYRSHPAIFAAAAFLHADDVGAHVTQQARAIWARDVAPEVEHSNAFQDLAHDPPFAWVLAKSLDRAC